MLGAVKAALAQRVRAKAVLSSAQFDLEAKKVSCARLVGAPGKEDHVTTAEKAVGDAQAAVDMSRSDFEAVSARVVREARVPSGLVRPRSFGILSYD